MTTGMKHLAAYQANLLDYNAAKDRECNYIGNQEAVLGTVSNHSLTVPFFIPLSALYDCVLSILYN